MSKINVYSEIGRLKKVMLHRPGDEIDGVIPQTMPRHLFDDIPWKKGAQYEHDCFADILRSEGTEVVYIEDLFRESFDREGSRGAFLERFLDVHGIHNGHLRGQLAEYLLSLDARAMADKIMAGVRKSDIGERGLRTSAASSPTRSTSCTIRSPWRTCTTPGIPVPPSDGA